MLDFNNLQNVQVITCTDPHAGPAGEAHTKVASERK